MTGAVTQIEVIGAAGLLVGIVIGYQLNKGWRYVRGIWRKEK